jgi:hypothetical protein
MEIPVGLVTAVVGALVGVIATYATTRSTMRIQLEHTYDRALRDIRLPHYQRLFHISKCLPRPGFYKKVPTRQDLLDFRGEFHDWFFGEGAGGMFLPKATRDLYFDLMDELVAKGKDTKESSLDSQLTPDELEALYQLASKLRHQLTRDLGAAQPPRLRGILLGLTRPFSVSSERGRDGRLEQQRSHR